MNRLEERKFIILGIFIVIAVIYLIRLFYIQVIDDKYKLDANNNVLRYNTEYPSRGLVYDRNGKLLVYNEAAYDLMVIPRQAKGVDSIELCKFLGITPEVYSERLRQAKAYSKFKPSVFDKQFSPAAYAAIQEKMYKFPGFFFQKRTLRYYPQITAAHMLGYVGEVDEKIISKNPYYKMGDYIGISGIEKSYEEVLRGKKGVKIVMVDVHNRTKGSFQDGLYDTAAVGGLNVISSIDAELQLYGEKLLQNKRGSIVAIEPSTGEILTLISSPAYDPNLLVGRERAKNYGKLAKDTLKPLFNRAIMASYPPGSTFKMAVALVAMQEGVLNSESRLPCSFTVGGKSVHCHPHPSPANVTTSIQYSCNPFYCRAFVNTVGKYKTAAEGYQVWKDHMNSFGFGVKLNTDVANELKGFIPAVEYFDRYHGKGRWKGVSIYSLGIGQGEVGVTPLQMANYAAILANRGYYYIPHLVKGIENGDIDERFKQRHYTTVDAKHFMPVVEAMHLVVEAGTARGGKIPGIPFCGKTGTAQNPHGKDHSIFIAFAPKDDPKIAIAVYVENAGFGATYGVPIASLMIEKYLTDTIKRPELEKRMIETNLLGN